jgi:predicted XRE-type DNA-binding protein
MIAGLSFGPLSLRCRRPQGRPALAISTMTFLSENKGLTLVKIERFENVWDTLETDPAERERLKLRAQLMDALRARVERWKVTQAEAAKRLKITQPRLNDLLKGRFNKFSLGALFDLATRAGLKIKLSIDGAHAKPKAKKAA